jgi:hypothetical protein
MSGLACSACDWRLLPLNESYPGDGKCPRCGSAVEVAPFGAATCLNCGDRFFPSSDPNEMFCDPDCAQQYSHGLGL